MIRTRTPLNSIIGFSDVLLEEAAGPLTVKQWRFVDNVRTAGRQLLALINDILDLSKVEAGRMELHLTRVDIEGPLTRSSRAGSRTPHAARRRQVLHCTLFPDVPLNLELITEVLEAAGHRVYSAGTASDGLAKARALVPDVVLMDIRLPDLDGREATRRLRSDPTLTGLTIIALTAQAMRGDAESALAAGCDAYISKPIDVRTIAAEIRRVVEQRQTTDRQQRNNRETPGGGQEPAP